MNKIDEKDDVCCTQEHECDGIESCDCQGICICEPLEDGYFEDLASDCDDCCCEDDDDDDDDEVKIG